MIYYLQDLQRGHVYMLNAWEEVKQRIAAGESVTVEVRDRKRTDEQNAKWHAMIGDIAKQYTHFGQQWKPEDMKRILVDAFRRDTSNDPDLAPLWAKMGETRMAPCIGGGGLVVLGEQTRQFPKKLGSAFIEWLYAFGAENQIRWSDE